MIPPPLIIPAFLHPPESSPSTPFPLLPFEYLSPLINNNSFSRAQKSAIVLKAKTPIWEKKKDFLFMLQADF